MKRLPPPTWALLLVIICGGPVAIADWPTYGGNASRNHATPEPLPNQLALQWIYRPSQPPRPAWPNSKRLRFDQTFHPIIAGRKAIFGSSADDTVTALDLVTGSVVWEFTADGPVRFAPVAWRDRVFVASDDGCLYALDLDSGELVWKHQASTKRQFVLGNGRLISRWPARGGPVVYGDTLYYAAGIWPSDGVYVYALQCETGKVVWSNTDSGTLLMDQPHGGARAESGIAPQGYLLADEQHLYLPTGRAVPAVLDRKSGKLLYYHLQKNRRTGGSWAMLSDRFVLNGGAAFHRTDGTLAGRVGLPPLASSRAELIRTTGQGLQLQQWIDAQRRDRKGKLVSFRGLETTKVVELSQPVTALLIADKEVVCGFDGRLSAIDIKAQANEWWSTSIEGTVRGLAYADGYLIAATDGGILYGFAGSIPKRTASAEPATAAARSDRTPPRRMPSTDGIDPRISSGYALVEPSRNAEALGDLASQSKLHILALAHTDSELQHLRTSLRQAGLYGTRVAVLRSDDSILDDLPSHFANLIVTPDAASPAQDRQRAALLRLLHPSRGVLRGTQPLSTVDAPRFEAGSGSWTHQWADAGNTVCSGDRLVRGRLAMNWFGSFDFATPNRHGQGPAPLSHNGFLVVGGVDGITCLDAYNGTQLWTYSIPGLLADYDGIHHDVGVGETGGRFCMSDDAVFVATENECLKLDLRTGRCVARFQTPVDDGATDRRWGVIIYHDGVLVGSVLNEAHRVSPRYALTRLRTESTLLFAVDASDGRLLWQYRPRHSVRNNAVAVAADRVFLIDRPIAKQDSIAKPTRGGRPAPRLKPGQHPTGTLLAIGLHKGNTLWRNDNNIWRTQLSATRDGRTVLMAYQAMKHKFFRIPSEVGGRLAAFDGSTGERLWDRQAEYRTRPIIRGGEILAEGGAWDLRSGEPRPFPFQRSYGCGQIAAGAHVLLYRSATLGYWDLSLPVDQQRTRSFGGFRPGCYINAIPAGGLVLIPEGSTHCQCSYQLKSWFALRPVGD